MEERAQRKQAPVPKPHRRKGLHPPRRLSRSTARESHQWYRLIVDNVRDFAIFSADLKGQISSWNPGAERFFGYGAEEILGKPMDLLYVPEDREAGIAERERRVAVERGTSEDERWHMRKDGTRFFVFGRVNPMYTDEGELCGFIKIARDTTGPKLLQERLDSSEEFHRLVLNNIQDYAIFTVDPQARISSWNSGAERTYSYKREEIIGQKLAVLYTPEDRARGEPEHSLGIALKEGCTEQEHWCIRKDGRRIFVAGVVQPIRDESGSIRAFSNIGRDITARRQLREELERARAELEAIVAQRTASLTEAVHELETFSYTLSHDMRAPLRAIEGFATEVIARYSRDLPEPGKELMGRIAAAAERMDRLIRESLSFYRGGREPLALEATDLEPLLGALSLEYPGLAQELTLTVRRPLLKVMAHPPSLTQALSNLLSNALRFVASDRKAFIELWTEPRNGHVRICVKDNGIGIAPQDRDKVWNLFTRLHPDQFEGTGIGLPLVRRAVERMRGTTGVESQEGKGSLFWIELDAVS